MTLPVVDWGAPWLEGVGGLGRRVTASGDWRGALDQHAAATGLRNLANQPVSFVTQDNLPGGTAYESHIHATGRVPTRDNLHDLFNALVWLVWPQTKAQLNHLQATQIARQGVGHARGATRDAVTLFDENAAILAVTDGESGDRLIDALRQHRWHDLFVDNRSCFEELATPLLFGHALMEKLVNPYKAITAHTLICRVDAGFQAQPVARRLALVDAMVAERVRSQGLQARDYTPLPVLGVPGWWPGQDSAFYDDASVFRPPRLR